MFNPSPHTFGRQEWLECMEKVKSRDTQAFALVFSYYSPKLKQFVMKHVGSEQVALELVQETMSTVWQKASLFDGQKSSLATWIYTIARNLSYDLLRRQKGVTLMCWPMIFGRKIIVLLIWLITTHRNKICSKSR